MSVHLEFIYLTFLSFRAQWKLRHQINVFDSMWNLSANSLSSDYLSHNISMKCLVIKIMVSFLEIVKCNLKRNYECTVTVAYDGKWKRKIKYVYTLYASECETCWQFDYPCNLSYIYELSIQLSLQTCIQLPVSFGKRKKEKKIACNFKQFILQNHSRVFYACIIIIIICNIFFSSVSGTNSQ